MDSPATVKCRFCGAATDAEESYCFSCHRIFQERADDLGLPATGPPRPEIKHASAPPTDASPRPRPSWRRIFWRASDPAPLRCRSCGAPLSPTPSGTSVVCAYCKTTTILPAPASSSQVAPTSSPSAIDWMDDGDDDDGDLGMWGYERRVRAGPGWGIIGGVMFIIIGLVWWGMMSSVPPCVPPNGGAPCPPSPLAFGWPLLVFAFGGGAAVVAYSSYRVWRLYGPDDFD